MLQPPRHPGSLPARAIITGAVLLLVQQPVVADDSLYATLEFASYIGKGGSNTRSVVTDKAGNVYISGGAGSPEWPTTDGSKHSGGSSDVAITKLSPDGKLLWSILLGGPSEEYAYVSAVNDRGELYVAGRAGEGFPTTEGAFDRSFNGGVGGGPHSPTDAFVLKLSTAGKLIYSTYIGGSGDENGRAIHLLPSGKLVVAGGNTRSADLPTDSGTLPGPVLKPRHGGHTDSWIAVVAEDGRSLDFLTYFGANDDPELPGSDLIRSLGTDSRGNIWIGGETFGTDLTPTADAFQKVRNRPGSKPRPSLTERVRKRFPDSARVDKQAFVAKISPDGRKLVYFSWLGGNGYEDVEDEGISDAQGNFYIAGATSSTDFPVSPGARQATLRNAAAGDALANELATDGYVARINDDGSLGFATLFGGSAACAEGFFGPALDQAGNVCATGFVCSTDIPLTTHAVQRNFAGPAKRGDAVLACFSPDGKQLRYASYYGGSRNDRGRHISIGPDGHSVYIVGETGSRDLPRKNAFNDGHAGAFIAKFLLREREAGTR